jgi:hypothetical protein
MKRFWQAPSAKALICQAVAETALAEPVWFKPKARTLIMRFNGQG